MEVSSGQWEGIVEGGVLAGHHCANLRAETMENLASYTKDKIFISRKVLTFHLLSSPEGHTSGKGLLAPVWVRV